MFEDGRGENIDFNFLWGSIFFSFFFLLLEKNRVSQNGADKESGYWALCSTAGLVIICVLVWFFADEVKKKTYANRKHTFFFNLSCIRMIVEITIE